MAGVPVRSGCPSATPQNEEQRREIRGARNREW